MDGLSLHDVSLHPLNVLFWSFSEAGGHLVGFYVARVIRIVRHLPFSCHLSAKVKILLVKL